MRQTFNLIFLSWFMKNLFERASFTLGGQTAFAGPSQRLLHLTNCPCCRHSGRAWRWGCDDMKDPSSFWRWLSPVESFFFPKLWIFCQSFSIKLSLGSVQLEHLPQVRTKCTELLGLSVKYHLNRFKGQMLALASSFWKDFLDHYWPVVLDIRAAHDVPLC